MAETTTSEVAALREELERSRAEVQRLRGILIERDLELGRARGRLEQLEERTARLLGYASFLRRLGPERLRALVRGRS